MKRPFSPISISASLIPLLACLAAAGCSQERQKGEQAPSDTGRATEPAESVPPSANMAAPEPEGASIMRPTVAEKAEPAPAPAPRPVRMELLFDSGEVTLDDAARSALDSFVTTAALSGDGRITIRGHTDSRGSDTDNKRVSETRAEAVRDYLAAKGVPADRMTIFSLGETRPVAPNAHLDGSDDEQGRQKNRRVEVVLSDASA